jgi:glycosyltransferase involved in cell wall biosynthesis
MVLTSTPEPLPPLVTVVTSTWQRPVTLRDYAVKSVNSQTYPEVQHLVVIDGCDKATVRALEAADYTTEAFYHIGQQEYEPNQRRYIELGRNWSTYSGDGGFGATCRLTGSWMAAGEFITYLDDDAYYEPAHIAEMVAAFDPETMFVTCPWAGPCTPCPGPPPGLNRTDTSTIMHRAIVLRDHGGFRPDGYAGDGYMTERWLAAGLPWKWKEGVTVSHPTGTHNGGPMP